MVKRANLKVALVIAGVFLIGASTGAVLTFAWSHQRLVGMLDRGGPIHHEMRMRALQRTLGLSAEQQRTIAEILERDAPRRRQVMGQVMRECGDPMRKHKSELAKRQAEKFLMDPGWPPGPGPRK
jgi:uncharacterized membrane protein